MNEDLIIAFNLPLTPFLKKKGERAAQSLRRDFWIFFKLRIKGEMLSLFSFPPS